MFPVVKSIEDLEKLFYSAMGSRIVQKDAPVISTTTGVYNPIFGLNAWSMLNQEANMFGALTKYVQMRSGWRVITARAAESGGGVADNGDLPSTIKPTFAELSTKPKTVAHTFDVSETQDFLASYGGDDAYADMEKMRPLMAVHHKEMINKMLLGDNDTVAGNNIESVDRVVCSKDEEDNNLTGGDGDIYGLDRSASTTYDAYVDENSGTDRDLTDTLIRTLEMQVKTQGGNPTFWFTGLDTYSKIQGIYDTYVRYTPLGEKDMKIGINGIQSAEGIGVGINIATMYKYPVITSKDVKSDTISRLYLLDSSDPEGFGEPRLGLRIAKPTQYFEAGMNTGNPFAINRLGNEGMYRTMAELICTNFKSQGKLRDLK